MIDQEIDDPSSLVVRNHPAPDVVTEQLQGVGHSEAMLVAESAALFVVDHGGDVMHLGVSERGGLADVSAAAAETPAIQRKRR
ncbi:hypothetical protein [Herbidospora cretacea]|uniref:hypothetical protein n=1 Tax=Herbidospora cretacea TaxID=28444 RepID=UPI0018CBF9BF|nr:hypothetical protein [Herbidospora cretacea]